MALDKRDELLRDRAARALGVHGVAEAVAKVRAIIGPQNIPDSEPLAQAAFDKLHQGDTPSAEELTALEIVVRLLRPVVSVRNGSLDDLPDTEGHNLYPEDLKALWSTFRGRVQSILRSIGRIENAAGEHIGTGFLVADGLLATNRHVLGVLTFGAEVLQPGTARVVLKQEIGLPNSSEDVLPIERVAAIHPKLDMVLLAVAKLGRPIAELESVAVRQSVQVVTIGFPAKDTLHNPLFLAGVFQGKFGYKSAAIGEVLDGSESPAIFHDCSTTQGNSGSPIFNLTTGKVAGIHRAGFFMYRNEGVDAEQLGQFVQAAQP